MAETFKKFTESWVNTLINLKDKAFKATDYADVNKTLGDLSSKVQEAASSNDPNADFIKTFIDVTRDAHFARLQHYIKTKGLPAKITLPTYKVEEQ
jgi:hypothetical protein